MQQTDRRPGHSESAPYDGLTPAVVLDALDGVGLRGDGRLLQLNSYENRVFQVYLENGDVVVAKFYRPHRWSNEQILEEHEFAAELAAQEIPVVAALPLTPVDDALFPVQALGRPATLGKVALPSGPFRFSVSSRRVGHAPELDDYKTLAWIGRFIGRIHAVGRTRSFEHRKRLSVEELGRAARNWLVEHDVVPDESARAWTATADAALDAAQELFDQCSQLRMLRLHGDCHPGNLLWTPQGPHFVDLDDAVNGPAMQDLWMLLSGDRTAMARQLSALLSGYDNFANFDRRELCLIEALRTLRMIHHSAWLAQRWTDPAFPLAFPWFADGSYWQQQSAQLREQLEAMREPPLVLGPLN